MKYIKVFESLEERTSKSFYEWYNKLLPILNEEDQYKYETQLKSWLIYKPYFDEKNIFNFKDFESYQTALELAKQKYFSKFKNLKSEVDVIYEDSDIKILVPLTLNGSCKYGFNAKWCTAMLERPEHFDWYKRSGELYRFILKNDEKYSLHWANNGNKFYRDQLNNELENRGERFVLTETPFELTDEGKKAVSIDYITKKWDYNYVKKWKF